MDDSDALFEDIIEVDYVGESDDNNSNKENEKYVKRLKAKKKQIKKLEAFMAGKFEFNRWILKLHWYANVEHGESSIEKDKFKERWRNLIRELNDLGPPTFTDSEWKLKWSQHKYNKKRTLESEEAGPSRQRNFNYFIL